MMCVQQSVRIMAASKQNEKIKNMPGLHNDSDASLKDLNREDHEEDTNKDDTAMELEQDDEPERNNDMEWHVVDGESSAQEEPIPFQEEKPLQNEPTEQQSQNSGAVEGEDRGNHRSRDHCEAPIDEIMDKDGDDGCEDDGKGTSAKSAEQNGEERTNKDESGMSSDEPIVIDVEQDYNEEQDPHEKKPSSHENTVEEIQETPNTSQVKERIDNKSEGKEQKSHNSDQSLQKPENTIEEIQETLNTSQDKDRIDNKLEGKEQKSHNSDQSLQKPENTIEEIQETLNTSQDKDRIDNKLEGKEQKSSDSDQSLQKSENTAEEIQETPNTSQDKDRIDNKLEGKEQKSSDSDQSLQKSENTAEEIKQAPNTSQVKDRADNGSKGKEPKSPDSDQSLQVEDKRNTDAPSPSFASAFNGLVLEGKDDVAVAGNSNDDTALWYPLDGHWEMSWKTYPASTTTFEVRSHTFKMFDCPCEIMLVGPIHSCCPCFQLPEALTSAENPVFSNSLLVIPPNMKTKECPTTIEWRTTDWQYGEITWTRLNPSGGKVEVANKESTDMVPCYPLDGNWELSWESYPSSPSTFVVQNHNFKLFDFSVEIKMGGQEDNYSPTFQWPVAVTSFATPVFQKTNVSFPPGMERTEWPNRIQWTTTDPDHGVITWTRLSSCGAKQSDTCERKRSIESLRIKCFEDDASIKKRRELEEFKMKSSIPGKAWDLVEEAIKLSSETENIETIAKDDIIYLAERLLENQEGFGKQGIPKHVDIAYHHTRSENVDTIKTDGLLSRVERERHNIHSRFNGSAFGEGIYCSFDPIRFANSRYGDTTILLARMKGTVSGDRFAKDNNTFEQVSSRICVLKCSNQCVPLFTFPSILLQKDRQSETRGNDGNFRLKLAKFQKTVQTLLDRIFNNNVHTQVNDSWLSETSYHNRRPMLQNPRQRFPPPPHQAFGQPFNPFPSAHTSHFTIPAASAPTPTKQITIKEINNCNSVTELQNVIRFNSSSELIKAAKKRLMTVCPSSYSKFCQQNTQQNNIQHLPPAGNTSHHTPFAQVPNGFPNTPNLPYLNPSGIKENIAYTAPNSMTRTEDADFCKPVLTHKQLLAGCPNCVQPLRKSGKVIRITKCGHIFHSTCLKKSMEQSSYCPVCSVPISDKHWRGTMPSGSMDISQIPTACAGYEGYETIVITYHFPSSIQKQYHPNPGQPLNATSFTAYVPTSPEGLQLLRRLKFAFSRGLTFSVGTCPDTGRSNSVVWGVHHKTSQVNPSYPDPSYIFKCNIVLNCLHVPSATSLLTPITNKQHLWQQPQQQLMVQQQQQLHQQLLQQKQQLQQQLLLQQQQQMTPQVLRQQSQQQVVNTDKSQTSAKPPKMGNNTNNGNSITSSPGFSSNSTGSNVNQMTPQEVKKQKEKFLMFTRILIKYLGQKDKAMCQEAKSVIKDCAERNKRQEAGYESVTRSMKLRLKKLVGAHYWKMANDYFVHFIEQKKRQAFGNTGGSKPSNVTQQNE